MPNWFEKAGWSAFVLRHGLGEKRFPYRPIDELTALQDRRVRAMVAHAYKTVPFYREEMDRRGLKPSDFQRAGDLAKLPFVTGEALSKGPERFLSSVYIDRPKLELTTTGSVGVFKRTFHDPASLFLAMAAGQRQRYAIQQFTGRLLRYREVSVVREGSTTPDTRRFYEAHSLLPRSLDIRRAVTTPADSFEKNIETINAFKPDVVSGFGSYIGAMFRRAREKGLLIHHPKVVKYGGDFMFERDKSLIENDYRIPVVSSYQSCECLRIAFQCERREGFHISLDQAAVRVVDREGNNLAPGKKGEIIVSNLVNRATVLLNYKIGDTGELGPGPCPCGRTLPVIAGLDGRTEDLVLRPDGEMAHESVILPLLYGVRGMVKVQLIQESPCEFLMRVVCSDGADYGQVRRGLRKALCASLGGDEGISIDFERLDDIGPDPGGKFRAIISRCAKNP